MITMKFKEWDCIVRPAHYGNGRKALELVENGPLEERIAVATVNLDGTVCPDHCAYIKDYSENEGMVTALIMNGLIKPRAVMTVQSGHVTVGLYRFTEKALNLFK